MKSKILINKYPAHNWQSATPIGNGRLGALVMGSIYDERVILNHENLYDGAVNKDNPEKPFYTFEGLACEEEYFKKNPIYDYYFFAGSLYERYGVKNMIDAFHKSSIKAKLVIAGTGPLASYINKMSIEDYRILYLAQLSHDKITGYEKNALANINPRPLNKKIDDESIPSKLIEYLATGVPTISTKHPKFYNIFKDNVYWIENNDINSIIEALENFEKEPKEIAKKKAFAAKAKTFEFYGLDVQGESITHFLASISSSKRS